MDRGGAQRAAPLILPEPSGSVRLAPSANWAAPSVGFAGESPAQESEYGATCVVTHDGDATPAEAGAVPDRTQWSEPKLAASQTMQVSPQAAPTVAYVTEELGRPRLMPSPLLMGKRPPSMWS